MIFGNFGQNRLDLIIGRVHNISFTDSQSTFPTSPSNEDTYTASRSQTLTLVSQVLDLMPRHPQGISSFLGEMHTATIITSMGQRVPMSLSHHVPCHSGHDMRILI